MSFSFVYFQLGCDMHFAHIFRSCDCWNIYIKVECLKWRLALSWPNIWTFNTKYPGSSIYIIWAHWWTNSIKTPTTLGEDYYKYITTYTYLIYHSYWTIYTLGSLLFVLIKTVKFHCCILGDFSSQSRNTKLAPSFYWMMSVFFSLPSNSKMGNLSLNLVTGNVNGFCPIVDYKKVSPQVLPLKV